jgi:predicted metal-dependent phosphoesterase TrpH
MVDVGAVPDIDAAFAEYLGEGMPAYVPKRALDPVRGVRLLRGAGGVAVLAHPAMSQPAVSLGLVDRMAQAGLAGVEAEHAGHDPEQVGYWRAVTRERGLEITGSSDFHGRRKDLRLGERTTSRAVIDRMRAQCLQVRPG